jgi:hypothetical protein
MNPTPIRLISVILATSIMHGCSSDFQPNLTSDPTPVVYGVIQPGDSLYQVRLTKTFIGPASALHYARVPDSLYFKDARVYLETRNLENQLIERVELEETVIEDKEDGLFAEIPNLVYQTDASKIHLRQAYFSEKGIPYDINLHLIAEIPRYDQPVTAISRLRYAPRITEPRVLFVKVYLYGESTFWMQWNDTNEDGLYEILVRFHYTDFLDEDERDMTAEWVLTGITVNESSFPGGTRRFYSYYFRPDNFYAKIRTAIPDDPLVEARVAKSVDFIILSSNREMEYYNEIYEIADDYHGSGYSNIGNGLGLFTTYTSTGIYGLSLGQNELDSLAGGKYTKHLKFRNWGN